MSSSRGRLGGLPCAAPLASVRPGRRGAGTNAQAEHWWPRCFPHRHAHCAERRCVPGLWLAVRTGCSAAPSRPSAGLEPNSFPCVWCTMTGRLRAVHMAGICDAYYDNALQTGDEDRVRRISTLKGEGVHRRPWGSPARRRWRVSRRQSGGPSPAANLTQATETTSPCSRPWASRTSTRSGYWLRDRRTAGRSAGHGPGSLAEYAAANTVAPGWPNFDPGLKAMQTVKMAMLFETSRPRRSRKYTATAPLPATGQSSTDRTDAKIGHVHLQRPDVPVLGDSYFNADGKSLNPGKSTVARSPLQVHRRRLQDDREQHVERDMGGDPVNVEAGWTRQIDPVVLTTDRSACRNPDHRRAIARRTRLVQQFEQDRGHGAEQQVGAVRDLEAAPGQVPRCASPRRSARRASR